MAMRNMTEPFSGRKSGLSLAKRKSTRPSMAISSISESMSVR